MHALLQSSKQMHLKQVHLELCRNKLQKQSIWRQLNRTMWGTADAGQCWTLMSPFNAFCFVLIEAQACDTICADSGRTA